MPSSLNAILIAWALSLILVVGGFMEIEFLAAPPAAHEEPTHEPTSKQPEASAPADEADDHAAQPEETPAGHETAETSHTEPASTPEPAGVTLVDDALIEQSPLGPLPKRGSDGMTPMERYASPHPADETTPRIAIIVSEMGLRAKTTEAAITGLPGAVSLAFSPYGSDLDRWTKAAREHGHETLLLLPMEPIEYPQMDPGALALLTGNNLRQNTRLLETSMAKFTGYVGVVNQMGSRFTAAADSLKPILEAVERRGLLFVDARTTRYSRAASMARGMSLPVAINNGFVDETLEAAAMRQELLLLENRARTVGAALGIARPYPITVGVLKEWADGLAERGFILVPVTAIADRQPVN